MFIKFNLVKLDKTLIFQILDQDLKRTPSLITFHVDGYQVTIAKDCHPEINYHKRLKEIFIFTRGTESQKHLEPVDIYFENNFDRDEVFDILVKSLRKVSNEIKDRN